MSVYKEPSMSCLCLCTTTPTAIHQPDIYTENGRSVESRPPEGRYWSTGWLRWLAGGGGIGEIYHLKCIARSASCDGKGASLWAGDARNGADAGAEEEGGEFARHCDSG